METVVGVLAIVGAAVLVVAAVGIMVSLCETAVDKLRCPKMPACDKCGVVYKPRGYGADYSNLCKTHADEKRTLDLRKRVVREWSDANWESLEKKAKAWNEKRNRGLHHRNEQYGALSGGGLAAQQAAACQQTRYTGGLMPIPLRDWSCGLR